MNRKTGQAIVIGAVAAACLAAGGAALLAGGCTEQQRARSLGGETTIELPKGKKLVVATWKGTELWFLTRDMREGDLIETYEFIENSSFGILQGKVTIKEAPSSRPW
jgi:hypothetical protein